MITLLIAMPSGDPLRFSLPPEKPTAIGRAPDNDCVVGHPHVSGHHATLSPHPEGGFLLRDLGSHNGTRVNGERIQECRVKHGDRIVFGILEAKLEESPAPNPKPEPNPPETAPPKPVPLAPKQGAPVIAPLEPPSENKAPAKKPTVRAKAKGAANVPASSEGAEEIGRELIQRIDLVEDLIERYQAGGEAEDFVSDLRVLKESLKDLLRNFAIESYSIAPQTEVDLELRKRIEIVSSDRPTGPKASTRIAVTLHDGYLRKNGGGAPVIVRKAHVITCVAGGN